MLKNKAKKIRSKENGIVKKFSIRGLPVFVSNISGQYLHAQRTSESQQGGVDTDILG